MSTKVNFLQLYNYIFKYLVFLPTKAYRERMLFLAMLLPFGSSCVCVLSRVSKNRWQKG